MTPPAPSLESYRQPVAYGTRDQLPRHPGWSSRRQHVQVFVTVTFVLATNVAIAASHLWFIASAVAFVLGAINLGGYTVRRRRGDYGPYLPTAGFRRVRYLAAGQRV